MQNGLYRGVAFETVLAKCLNPARYWGGGGGGGKQWYIRAVQ